MKTFNSLSEYQDAKCKLQVNDFAASEYRKEHKTNGISVAISAMFPYADEIDNDLRSAIEVWEFVHDIPEKYFLYISREKGIATTWTGQNLGRVSFGRSFRSNMNDERVPITVNAINGKIYHGTFYKSAGDYARIRLSK